MRTRRCVNQSRQQRHPGCACRNCAFGDILDPHRYTMIRFSPGESGPGLSHRRFPFAEYSKNLMRPAPGRPEKIFQEGLQNADPSNLYLLDGLGRSQLLLNAPDQALRTFADARKIKPDHPAFASGQGWALWNLHRYGEAKHAFEDALKLDPNSVDLRLCGPGSTSCWDRMSDRRKVSRSWSKAIPSMRSGPLVLPPAPGTTI